jgi:hypothetical protein
MNLIMNNGWRRRIHRLLGCAVIASAISFAGARTAAAQAGSAGGTIGKQEKSVSGGEESEASRPSKSQRQGQGQRQGQNKRGPTTASGHNSEASCRSTVGVWTSWAAGIYGRNDTRINSDGTIKHPSSKGTWSCSGGEHVHVWDAFGVRGPYRLSPDGKRLIKIQDGSVSFSRN